MVGKIHIAGSGAGQESTASGLISDLVHLVNTMGSDADLSDQTISNLPLKAFSELAFKYYFYIEAKDIPGVMASITSLLAVKGVGIESILQKEELGGNLVPIILITDIFKDKDSADLQIELLALDSVKKIRSIRIEAE